MRIISGSHKGILINTPSNLNIRPTTDYAKSSLFNILNNYYVFEQIKVADLFSGSGGISYEFASRGCNCIYSVERDFKNQAFIKDFCAKHGFSSIKTFKMDVFMFLKSFPEGELDFVFADPPYSFLDYPKLLEMVFSGTFIKCGGWFVLEHSSSNDFSNHADFKEKRTYGAVNYSFFIKK